MGTARTMLAIVSGKTAGAISRAAGRGGGTALPGLIATRIDAGLIDRLADQIRDGSVIISATNGKTTTARMTSAIARAWGREPIANRAGSNLLRGLATTLLEHAGPTGTLRLAGPAIGVFELDEGVVPLAYPRIRPRAISLGNLFRDQLDRYGEVELIADRWRAMIAAAGPELTVCLNADDPVIAALGRSATAANIVYHGIEDPTPAIGHLEHAADSKWCPDCGRPFTYDVVYYAHLGHYACPAGHWQRPAPSLIARRVEIDGLRGSRVEVESPAGRFEVSLAIPGLFNVYNALAAIGVSLALGCPIAAIQAGLAGVTAAFGRLEFLTVGGRRLWLLLSKNPTGFNASLRTVFAGEGPRHSLLVLNDRIADGRDISWIWDVDFEPYAGRFGTTIVSGTRGEELALRLQYARPGDAAADPPAVEPDLGRAIDRMLAETPDGEDVFILATYTAMIEIQQILARRGWLPNFWERA